METKNFDDWLNLIVEKIEKENDKIGNKNPSYSLLLKKLSKFDLIFDLDTINMLLYFLADSYSGSKEISYELGQFLMLCKKNKKK